MGAATSVVGLFERTVRTHPDRTALVSGDTRVTWAELAERVARTTTAVSGRLEPGSRVGLVMGNHPGFVETFLAVLAAGAVAVPLNPELTDAELAGLVATAGVDLLVHGADGDAARDESTVGVPVVTNDELDAAGPGGGPPGPPGPGAPALVGFSSGSTGTPKTVVRTHANLVAEADAFGTSCAVDADDRILAAVPLFHAHGLGNALLASLRSGAALTLMRGFSRDGVLDALDRHRITIFPSVPFALGMLSTSRRGATADLGALRLCFTAGGPLPRETFDAFRSSTGVAPRQLYGCTEGGALTLNREPDPTPGASSVGTALHGVEVRVDDDPSPERSADDVGEIVVRAGSLARRYESGSAPGSSFVGGWFHTGDTGHLDADGRLHVRGRLKVYIATAGNKVDPTEVENAIRTHPAVNDVAVVGVAARDGTEAVKAVVVGEVTRADVVGHCRDRLAEFKVPRIVELRDSLPRDAVGKIRRADLE